jgi:hypothetical protein
VISNLTLLLSFGLCSPVLCGYITLSICVYLCCWLILIGRFVYFRMNWLLGSQSPFNAGSPHWPFFFSHLYVLVVEAQNRDQKSNDDPFLCLLNHQLRGANSSLLICKWPVTLTSCFFVTLLAWDMAGDKGGWFQALWVLMGGVAITIAIWLWGQLIQFRVLSWTHLPVFFSCCSSLHPNDHPRQQPNHDPKAPVGSLEIVRSSLHHSPFRPENLAAAQINQTQSPTSETLFVGSRTKMIIPEELSVPQCPQMELSE